MKGLSLSNKIAAIVIIQIAMAVMIATVGITRMAGINTHLDTIVDVTAQRLNYAQAVRADIFSVIQDQKNVILEETDEGMKNFIKQKDERAARAKDKLRDWRRLADDKEQKDLDQFEAAWKKFLEVDKKICELSLKNTNVKSRDLSMNEARKAFDAMLKPILAIQESCQKRLTQNMTTATQTLAMKTAQVSSNAMELKSLLLTINRDEKDLIMELSDEAMQRINQGIMGKLAAIEPYCDAIVADGSDEDKAGVEAFKQKMNTWRPLFDQVRALTLENANTVAFKLSTTEAADLRKEFAGILDRIVDRNQGYMRDDKKNSDTAYLRAKWWMLGLSAAGIALASLIAFLTMRSLTRQIRGVVAKLSQGSEQVASASGQVSQSSQQMAEGASEQASSLEEISSSLEELTSMTRQNADNARAANDKSGQAQRATEASRVSMERMGEAIGLIKSSADQTAKILKTIDEIAFQTNLLALNAAVEAARAGEAGKGFAVVAEEVRSLAQRSAEAAKNTAGLVEESQKNAERGVGASAEVDAAIRQIGVDIQSLNTIIGEVAKASEEQARGIDQINTAVAQMDQVTQSNAANAEESASASEELSAQAREMTAVVETLVRVVEGGHGSNRQLALATRQSHSAETGAKKAAHAKATPQATRSGAPADRPGQVKPAPAIPLGETITGHEGKASNGMCASQIKKGGQNHDHGRVVRPEQIIPLDDEEFKEF